jgi:tetraacyldisaccharide 4'-kinase
VALSESFQQFGRQVISGSARGVLPAVLRGTFSALSPFYSAVMRLRNFKFDHGVGVRRLGRPVVSVGNITAGGTGKTPVVRWLCERFRAGGDRPAVLMRGYKARPGERGDEQAMLEGLLNREGLPAVVVQAQADRYGGGLAVLREHPEVNVLVLDDGFQHRRLGRDFDLVLVDAAEPFGFGRTFPRGLLREPPSGLKRADAILITRADQVEDVGRVEGLVRRYNSDAPIFRCAHAQVGLRSAESGSHALEALAGKKFFAFAGIGNPEGLAKQLKALPGEIVGGRWFGDHWRYVREDFKQVMDEARGCGAEAIVTTEKDWVKVSLFMNEAVEIPIWRIELALKFEGEDERKLFELIHAAISATRR